MLKLGDGILPNSGTGGQERSIRWNRWSVLAELNANAATQVWLCFYSVLSWFKLSFLFNFRVHLRQAVAEGRCRWLSLNLAEVTCSRERRMATSFVQSGLDLL